MTVRTASEQQFESGTAAVQFSFVMENFIVQASSDHQVELPYRHLGGKFVPSEICVKDEFTFSL